MLRSRIVALGLAAALSLSVGLTACGVSGSDGASGGGDSEKQALVDQLIGELESSGNVPPEQVACIKEGFNGFTVEELTTLRDSEDSGEVPTELQDKILSVVTACVAGESASPAPS